jgi:hypothetical protein
MTNVIIIGEQPEKKELKPIQFVKTLEVDGNGLITATKAKDCKEIVLLARNYKNTEMDLFFIPSFCNSNENQLYLGHFNDGIV